MITKQAMITVEISKEEHRSLFWTLQHLIERMGSKGLGDPDYINLCIIYRKLADAQRKERKR